MDLFTDEQKAALADGASALRYRAEKLNGVISFWHENDPAPKVTEARAMVESFRSNADILDKLAEGQM